jgi:molybdopterin synthase catalytic subunit
MVDLTIKVQSEAFDSGALLNALAGEKSDCGAVSSFLGQVRGSPDLLALELEHYPGVTQKALERIATHAAERWNLRQAVIVHRIGRMSIGEAIVFVGASAPHRRAALEATSFMIDVLKTQAPFWKKEHTTAGSRWVDTRAEDDQAASKWLETKQDQIA